MLPQPPVIRIHLSDRRHCIQTESKQALFTLPGETEVKEQSFQRLHVFCETSQKPGTTTHYRCSATGILFILPIVGKVSIHELNNVIIADAGQLTTIDVSEDQQVEFTNVYQSEWISYLLWEFKTEIKAGAAITDFDIESYAGRLINVPDKVTTAIPLTVQLGMFNGRQDYSLTSPNPAHKFIFVIDGAFEVQNRLLHARDALSIPNCSRLGFEALSNKAIILILSIHE